MLLKEDEKFGDLNRREDARHEVFHLARKIQGRNQNATDEICMKDSSHNIVYDEN